MKDEYPILFTQQFRASSSVQHVINVIDYFRVARFVVSTVAKRTTTLDFIMTMADIGRLAGIDISEDPKKLIIDSYDSQIQLTIRRMAYNGLIRIEIIRVTPNTTKLKVLMKFRDGEYESFIAILRSFVDPNTTVDGLEFISLRSCIRCNKIRPLDKFPTRKSDVNPSKTVVTDGLCNVCDSRAKSTRYAKRNPVYEDYWTRYKEANSDELRYRSLRFRELNREKLRESSHGKVYASSKNKKAKPGQSRSIKRAGRWLLAGKIKAEPCYVCGSTDRLRMNHIRYLEEGLDIVWMCSICIKRHHVQPQPWFCLLPKELNRTTINNLIVEL